MSKIHFKRDFPITINLILKIFSDLLLNFLFINSKKLFFIFSFWTIFCRYADVRSDLLDKNIP